MGLLDLFRKRGGQPYHGRLAFDPDSGYHIDPDGRRVVTPDAGATWAYASSSDPSHQSRYHVRVADIDSTANALALGHKPGAHHFAVRDDDPHADPENPGQARLLFDPDSVAASVTSHTDAKEDA